MPVGCGVGTFVGGAVVGLGVGPPQSEPVSIRMEA